MKKNYNKHNYYYTKEDIIKCLHKLGLKSGSSAYLTTSLGMFGILKDKKKGENLNKIFLDIIKKIIGPKGNIFVPTYSYSFSGFEEKTYDLKNTKAKIGPFPNYFLKQKGVIRSIDPMMSMAGIGPKVKKLFYNLPQSSFVKDCIYERFLKVKNFLNISLGLGPNWTPFNHYADQLQNVDYRYKKLFFGKVKNFKKKKKMYWVFTVRPSTPSAIANSHKVGNLAEKKKIWKSSNLGRAKVYLSDYKKYFLFTRKLQRKNPWILAQGPKCNILNIEKKKFQLNNIKTKSFKIKNNTPEIIKNFKKFKIQEFNDNCRNFHQFIKKIYKTKIFKFPSGYEAYDWIVPERKQLFKKKLIFGMDESLVSEYSNFERDTNRWNLIVCHINYPNSVKSILLVLDLIKNSKKFKGKKLKIIFVSSTFGLASYYKVMKNKLPKIVIHLNDEFCPNGKNYYDLDGECEINDKFFSNKNFNKKKIFINIYKDGFNPLTKIKIKKLKFKKVFLSFNNNIGNKSFEADKQTLFHILNLLK